MPLKVAQMRSVLEYVWQDANGHYRSKTKVMPSVLWEDSIETAPMWNFDGSSTGQATGADSEVYLRPYYKCMDVRRTISNQKYAQLIFCDLWIPDKDNNGDYQYEEGFARTMSGKSTTIREDISNYIHSTDLKARETELKGIYGNLNGRRIKLKPHPSNKREAARNIFEQAVVKQSDPWFGFEQEFFFYDLKTMDIVGWGREVEADCKFYCGVGRSQSVAKVRELAELVLQDVISIKGHLDCCGWNMEVAPGQCEFQIRGSGINAADNLTVFRYVLQRAAEQKGYGVTFHPKPKSGISGSGLHTNYSTNKMREANGYGFIETAVKDLERNHMEHMKVYGKDNELRMTGKHETAEYNKFTCGVADRTSSVRIPRSAFIEQSGYFEDRRPGANADPYEVSARLIQTTIIESLAYEEVNEPTPPVTFFLNEPAVENVKHSYFAETSDNGK
jgi:glutamine synthetase